MISLFQAMYKMVLFGFMEPLLAVSQLGFNIPRSTIRKLPRLQQVHNVHEVHNHRPVEFPLRIFTLEVKKSLLTADTL
jgi:hypothetical protein